MINAGTQVNEQLRQLPSVDELLNIVEADCPRELLVDQVRRVIDRARRHLKAGEHVDLAGLSKEVVDDIESLRRPSLRRVINATGVVLHTNLGRAPLPASELPAGYSNLEYDLTTGKRGKRDVHVASLLERLTGKPAIVVNNNAAAVYLVLNELAAGREVIVSRGELIEIGDGFRIPDIMARSGAVLREVGTTNRTRTADYSEAVNERTGLILRVHPSNFRVTGFVGRPELKDLVALSRERAIPIYEDLGSGCLIDLSGYGISEPLVTESIEAGVDVVSFSGDKLLGGPQAGIIAGRADLVTRVRRNPMFRALRVDKLIYRKLEDTLRSILFGRWSEIPGLQMIAMTAAEIRSRAERLSSKLRIHSTVEAGESVIGGGSTPDQSIPTFVLAFRDIDVVEAERRLRSAEPPVVARIQEDALILDLRTVLESDEDELVNALNGLSS